uniref:HIRAN domain-containing protein n=1 Tax=Amphimedon queenslandica TaxID=400682 RepID=A0A1X7V8J1_AMPQE
MEVEVSSCICSLYVYKDIWDPYIGEELVCSPQMNTPHDYYAVAVYNSSTIVGHIPKVLSKLCWLF